MSPRELTQLLISLDTAADVVEAIDNPALQRSRGWDLSGWRYDPVPWGVRFTCHDPQHRSPAEVLALVAVDGRLARRQGAPTRSQSLTVLMLG